MMRPLLFLTGALLAHLALNAQDAAPEPGARNAARQIDALLAVDWERNNLKPNPPASDEVFVRRIYLDVAGRIPTSREAAEFLESREPEKRAHLIDLLLASEGYVLNFFNYWADILRLQSHNYRAGPGITTAAYVTFLKDSLRANKPYDQFVRELVGSQGSVWENGPNGAVGYYVRDSGMPLDNAAITARIFLGTRMECAQCHDHPFDTWTQKQFYQMAAFTYGLRTMNYHGPRYADAQKLLSQQEQAAHDRFKRPEVKKDRTAEERASTQRASPETDQQAKIAEQQWREDQKWVKEGLSYASSPFNHTKLLFDPKSELRLPHDYQYSDMKPKDVVKAATLMGQPVDLAPGANAPAALARWMTAPENPRFTKVIANRLWKKVFGLGLIEPVDQLTDKTGAMNPELMSHLEKLMMALRYDMKAYFRVLLNTQTYQRAVSREQVEGGTTYHFTGPLLRRMSAEQIWDSFVTLISSTPDMPNATPDREKAERLLVNTHALSDAIDDLTAEELLQRATTAGKLIAEGVRRSEEQHRQLEQARLNGTPYEETASSIWERRVLTIRAAVNEHVFAPAINRLSEKLGGDPKTAAAPASASVRNDARPMMDMIVDSQSYGYERIPVPGYDVKRITPAQQAAESEAKKKGFLGEAIEYGIPEKLWGEYVGYRQDIVRNWLRAAEMTSPAPRGHFLREFGQSDREVVENANPNASIPQALTLMNSELLPKVMNRNSTLMLAVNKEPSPGGKMDAIYLAILSRKPIALEREKWARLQQQDGADIEDLISALLNTQQFIFIQ